MSISLEQGVVYFILLSIVIISAIDINKNKSILQ
jgi:hypothetical protein